MQETNAQQHRKFTHTDLGGLIVPLVTPLTEHGDIDKSGVQRLFDHVIGKREISNGVSYGVPCGVSDNISNNVPAFVPAGVPADVSACVSGVDAIFITGMTGEFQWLSIEQKKAMLDASVKACRGRVPLLFGATGKTTSETAELCRYSKDRADAVVIAPLLLTPSNNRLDSLVSSFAGLIPQTPVCLYNNPAFAAVHPYGGDKQISPDAFEKMLMKNRNVYGIKDSSGDLNLFEEYQAVAGKKDGAMVSLGDEDLLLRYSDNIVPSFANIMPGLLQKIRNSKRHGERIDFFNMLAMASGIIYCNGSMNSKEKPKIRGGLKYALNCLGICGITTLEQGQQLLGDEKAAINEYLKNNPMR